MTHLSHLNIPVLPSRYKEVVNTSATRLNARNSWTNSVQVANRTPACLLIVLSTIHTSSCSDLALMTNRVQPIANVRMRTGYTLATFTVIDITRV